MRLVIISGISGSGKSVALNVLEDAGFYCIDNIPVGLLRSFKKFSSGRTRTTIRSASDSTLAIYRILLNLRDSSRSCEKPEATARSYSCRRPTTYSCHDSVKLGASTR